MFRVPTSLRGKGVNNLGSLTTKGLSIIILKLYMNKISFGNLRIRPTLLGPFFCMTDDKLVDIINVQILLCTVYYNETIGPTILIQQMKCKKSLITNFKVNGITKIDKAHVY